MRPEVLLRKITIEEINAEVQRLRNEIQTHNHLDIGNAQLLTGEVKGILQSPNFVSGSSGWRISPDGTVEFSAGIFRGTLDAASGTLGAITIGSDAWHVDSSGNMWWGAYASYAAALDKASGGGIWSRLKVIRTEAGVGYYYENTANVQNVGVDIAMGDTTTNSLPAIRVSYGGTGYLLQGTLVGTGSGILVQRTVGAGTVKLLDLQSSNSAAGTMLGITRTGSGVITAINIDHATSSNSINTGIIMSLSSGNAVLCYAFRFNGLEIVSSAVGGSQNKKIRINIGGTDYYVPCYTT